MTTDLGQALGAFLQAVLVLVISAFLPVLLLEIKRGVNAWSDKLRGQLRAEDLAALQALARIFVTAAEQSGLTDELLKTGAAKKEWVLGQLQQAADQRQIHVNLETLSSVIEAVVWDTLGWDKHLRAVPPVESV